MILAFIINKDFLPSTSASTMNTNGALASVGHILFNHLFMVLGEMSSIESD